VTAFCGLSAVVLIALGWSGLIFVLGGVIVPAWGIGFVLCLISLVLTPFDRRIRAKLNREAGLSKSSWPRAFTAQAFISLGILACVLAILGDTAYSATYTVLAPAGPDGCQAVVREESFLMAGRGEVYAVHRLASDGALVPGQPTTASAQSKTDNTNCPGAQVEP